MTSDTSPRPVSPLRARMIEDMTVRGFNEDTRRDYVRHVRAFAAFIGRSPDAATHKWKRPAAGSTRRPPARACS
jgi:integrase/recombinase XerD